MNMVFKPNVEALADFPVTLADIQETAERIKGQILKTPFLKTQKLSDEFGAELWVKYENMQTTNSFKERGALNKLLQLTDKERKRGVIAVSAGNHAQAVAYHAARLGIATTIVMPVPTPIVKIEATLSYGAEVVLAGQTLSDGEESMRDLQAQKGLVIIHPYNDVAVIAGQGTIGLEMLESVPDLDAIVIPIGGGGLASGIAIAAKTLKPDIDIIGVKSELYASLYCMLNNKTFETPTSGTLAEGIAVKNVGSLTAPILSNLLSDLLLVTEADIERAINVYLKVLKTLAEGAGAAGLAALPQLRNRIQGKKVGIILCGGNIDPRLAATVMVRALEREEKIIGIKIAINDKPGVLGAITTLMGKLSVNILEVEHRRLFPHMPAKGAFVDITIEAQNAEHGKKVLLALEEAGYSVKRIGSGETEF